MKKLILLFFIAFGFMQTNAQCVFTHTVSGNTATFTPVPFATIYVVDSLIYDYGDGTGNFNIPLTQTTNSHTYAASGTYNVCHTYFMHQLGSPTNIITCFYCDSVTIQGNSSSCFVNGGFNFTASGLAVSFQNTTTCNTCTSLTTYWDYGDGTNSTMWQQTHTYAAPGTYTVCQYETGIDSNNVTCIDTTCQVITVGQSTGCTTSISLTSTNSSITATANATGGTAPYTYLYVLNPGSISNSSGLFTGLTPGIYTVCVTAIDAMQNTCSIACDSTTVGNVFGCNTAVTASATNNAVTATASANFGTPPYTYSYTLTPGNVTNSTGNFTGLAPGFYTVCATATDSLSATCTTDCDSVLVTGGQGCITTLSLSTSANNITANAVGSLGAGPYTYSYTLNPGNITNTTGFFSALPAGTYVVCATATDTLNTICSTDCDTITVGGSSPCTTNITASSSGTTITATATANFGTPPYTYSYTLFPGNITNNTGSFTGLTPGAYGICATATDANNVSCTPDCDSVVIGNGPGNCLVTAQFSQSINGLSVNFTNNSTITNGAITSTNWTFGDGNFSTTSSPSHTYATPGIYVVTLLVTGIDAVNNTCVDSASTQMIINFPSAVANVSTSNLTIYPNPTSNNFTVEIPEGENMEKLQITDVAGRKIEAQYSSQKNNLMTVSLTNQASGIYFIKLQTNRQLYTSSIMKQE